MTIAFIYGYPEETIADFKLTVELMERLRKMGVEEIQLGKFIPLPRTIETDKVKERLFFKEDNINFSIYKKYVFDDITKRVIKEHPELFVQYYSFDSDVRIQYGLFDLFHAKVISAGKIFFCCLNHILEKYTWLDLYDKYIKEIERYVNDKRDDMYKVNNFVEESCHFFNDVILQNELICESEFFFIAYSIEILLYRYCMTNKRQTETYKIGIDYLRMRKEGKLVRRVVKVMFCCEHGHLRIMQYETV